MFTIIIALILENNTAVITIGNNEFDELMNEIDNETQNQVKSKINNDDNSINDIDPKCNIPV